MKNKELNLIRQRKHFNLDIMKELLFKFANECRQITGKNQTELRKQKFEELCKANGVKYTFVGEKPDARACGVNELSNCYRFFPKCGHGRYNYAPCYEIKKD